MAHPTDFSSTVSGAHPGDSQFNSQFMGLDGPSSQYGRLALSSDAVPATHAPRGRYVKGDEHFINGATQQAQLVEPMPHAMWALYLLCLFLVVGVVWASKAQVDVVTRAQGKVITENKEQVISSLEGGILSKLMVKEGDLVEAGDDLVQLDRTRFEAQQNEGKARQWALMGSAARLSAEATGKPLNFPAELRSSEAGRAIMASETEAMRARRQVLDEAVAVTRQSIALLDVEIQTSRQMADRGLMSSVEVMRLDRQRNDMVIQMQERINRFRQDAATELVRVNSELSQVGQQQVVKEDALQRTTLKSPVRGIVKNLRLTTTGGVVGAGAPIMEIVPQSERLVVEARIAPADIGFVHEGLPVTVKLNTYDYYTYGGLAGTIEYLSPDTIGEDRLTPQQPDNAVYYRARIRADASQLHTAKGKPLDVLPGMSATVEIRTGERSVLEFLLSPMMKGREAFRER